MGGGEKREKWFTSAGGLLSNKRSTKMPEWIVMFLCQQAITGGMFFYLNAGEAEFWTEKYTVHLS